jgi:hypothetical protein
MQRRDFIKPSGTMKSQSQMSIGLAWEGLRLSGVTVKPFGSDFLETLKSVEVAESDPLA